ncbi:hypothetical protein AB3S75_020866 [Citrus x aurantiifolia]
MIGIEGKQKQYLQNALRIPEDGIGMKISSKVKPEVKLLLSFTFAICEYIGEYLCQFKGHHLNCPRIESLSPQVISKSW